MNIFQYKNVVEGEEYPKAYISCGKSGDGYYILFRLWKKTNNIYIEPTTFEEKCGICRKCILLKYRKKAFYKYTAYEPV